MSTSSSLFAYEMLSFLVLKIINPNMDDYVIYLLFYDGLWDEMKKPM